MQADLMLSSGLSGCTLLREEPSLTWPSQSQAQLKTRPASRLQTLSTSLRDDWPRAPLLSPAAPPATPSLTGTAPPLRHRRSRGLLSPLGRSGPRRHASFPIPGTRAKDASRLRRRTFLLHVSICAPKPKPNLWPSKHSLELLVLNCCWFFFPNISDVEFASQRRAVSKRKARFPRPDFCVIGWQVRHRSP